MNKGTYITDKNWMPGSYRRESFAGNLTQKKLNFRGIFLAKSKKKCVFRDKTLASLVQNGVLSEQTYQDYIDHVTSLMMSGAILESGTNETVMDTVHRIRTERFGTRIFRDLYRNTPAAAHKQNGIDQKVLVEPLKSRDAALFYLSDPEYVPDFLQEISHMADSSKKIYCLYFSDASGILPGMDTLKDLLGGLCDSITFLSAGDSFFSLDLSQVEYDRTLAEYISEQNAAFFGFGEDALIAARNLNLPAGIWVTPCGLPSMALTNLSTEAKSCLIYVPEHFDILPYIPIRERSSLTYFQLAYLAEKYGPEIYRKDLDSLIRMEPGLFVSLYDDHLPPVICPDFQYSGNSFPEAREAYFCEKLARLPGIRYLHATLDAETMEKSKTDWNGQSNKLLTDCVIISPDKSISVLCKEAPISPRKLFFDREGTDTSIVSNFAFFFTEKLILAYNKRLADRPEEQIVRPVGHIDYRLFYDEQGVRHESFPLYNKPCIAARKSGGFVSFSYKLGGGSVTMPTGVRYRFEKADVNPDAPGEVAVYTPMLSYGDESCEPSDYRLLVGKDRLNIVMIGEEIVCIRDGDVSMSCIGVVLSLSGKAAEALRKDLTPIGSSGYYAVPNPVVSVRLDPPEEITEDIWNDMLWVYGGGVPLIDGKEEITEASYMQTFREAGWLTPLSRQSQESAMHDISLHPRTAVGTTKDGELFILVISGRSNISIGADYLTLCRAAHKLIDNIDIFISWDGGGSTVLGILEGNVFTEISYPAPSDDTVAGMVRPINSIIEVKL